MTQYQEKHECCKCGWIGALEDRDEKLQIIEGLSSWLLVCPICAHDEFYLIEPKEECEECGWVGTRSEKQRITEERKGLNNLTFACPDCGHDAFQVLMDYEHQQ